MPCRHHGNFLDILLYNLTMAWLDELSQIRSHNPLVHKAGKWWVLEHISQSLIFTAISKQWKDCFLNCVFHLQSVKQSWWGSFEVAAACAWKPAKSQEYHWRYGGWSVQRKIWTNQISRKTGRSYEELQNHIRDSHIKSRLQHCQHYNLQTKNKPATLKSIFITECQ